MSLEKFLSGFYVVRDSPTCFCSLFDDLRPYALVQFVPCIAIPLMTILLPPMYTHSTYWLWAAGKLLI